MTTVAWHDRSYWDPLNKITKTEVCAACGGSLIVANDASIPAQVLRCPRCEVNGPETKPIHHESLKTRYRKGLTLENAGLTLIDSQTLDRQLRAELRRDEAAGKPVNGLTAMLLARLEQEVNANGNSRALAQVNQGVATQGPRQAVVYSPEEIAIIKEQIAPGVSDQELALFLATAQRRGLDPFAKQIYAVVRRTWNPEIRQSESKMVMQTGIDGYRIIAARTKKYAGQDRPVFGPMIPDTHCVGGAHPDWAEVTVYLIVNGQRVPVTATVYWDERVQMVGKGDDRKPNSMWCSQPRGQLAKCAEALALRKACPEEMSGLDYRDEAPAELPEAAWAPLPDYSDVDLDTGEVPPRDNAIEGEYAEVPAEDWSTVMAAATPSPEPDAADLDRRLGAMLETLKWGIGTFESWVSAHYVGATWTAMDALTRETVLHDLREANKGKFPRAGQAAG